MPNLRKPPVDYENVFRFKGAFELEDEDDTVKNCTVEVDRLPDLCLATGKIVVGDPFSIEEGRALARRVKPGAYRVERATRKDMQPDDPDAFSYEVACLRVVFSRLRPVRWAPAMPTDKFASLLMSRAQECCIADAPSLQSFCSAGEAIFDLLQDRDALSYTIDTETGGNLVCSGIMGYGSGPVCAFWGIDKNDKPCRLVCDFGVLSEAVYKEKAIATVEQLIAGPVSMKMQYGQVEVSATTHKRGKELRIKIAGDSVKNWNDLEFSTPPTRHLSLFSSSGGGHSEGIEYRYHINTKKAHQQLSFTVKYKTGTRSLISSGGLH